MTRATFCKACGATIFFIRTAGGKYTPVDAESRLYKRDPLGPDRIVTHEGDVIACQIDVAPEEADGIGFMSHFATCPAAASFRRR